MGARITSNALPAKAIRIVLTFALVFWASFRVECLAFGDVVHDGLSGHAEGTLNDIEIWQVKNLGDKDLEGDRVVSASETASGKEEAGIAPVSVGGTTRLVAIPAWQDSGSDDTLIGDFLEWEVDKESCADVDEKNGVVTLTGKSAGTVKVTCSIKDSDAKYVSESFKEKYKDKPFAASFKVDVQNPELTIELLAANGSALEAGQAIQLSEEERQSYAFGAHVTVIDPETRGKIAEFTDKDQSSLDESLQNLLTGFEWGLQADDGGEVGEDVATIDPDGVLHVQKDASFSVICSIGIGGQSYPASVHVTAGNPQGGDTPEPSTPGDDDQGASHPQKQLRVVANLSAGQGSKPDEGSNSGSNESAPNSAAKSEVQDGEGEKDGQNSSPANGGNPSATEGGQGAPAEDSSADGAASNAPKSINKVYGVEDLEELGAIQETYSMYGPSGWRIVKGEGPTLVGLLKDAGIEDLSEIESVTFEGLYGTTEVAWSDLIDTRSYFPHAMDKDYTGGEPSTPIVAIRSHQYSAEELAGANKPDGSGKTDSGNAGGSGGDNAQGAGNASNDKASEQGQGGNEGTAAPELVENTQFRLLFGATNPPEAAIDPDALRWINTIHVNMKGAPVDDAITDPTLKVRVGYVPVPLGETAVFSAIPNNEIGSARFNFRWQESVDGVTWVDVPNGSVQTLRILTTEERVGHQFRVIMETNLVNEEGKKRGATSDPVTMTVGDGFSVRLSYDPPIAGNMAIFRSSVSGIEDMKSVTYEWQSSTDGGATWKTVPNRTEPRLAVPTNPIEQKPATPSEEASGSSASSGPSDSSASAEKPKANPIIYVRVIARVPDGREAVSNVMPLTVRVGDTDNDSSGNGNPGDGTTGSGQAAPPNGESQPPSQSELQQSTPVVTQIDRIVYEDTSATTGQTPTAPSPTPDQAAAPEIYINPEMSEQIIEQVEAQQAQTTAATPGARWTEINAVNPGGDDVRRILSANPFAPFALPLGLGLIAAGGLERFLGFRRSIQ